jgi:hypothetical protein
MTKLLVYEYFCCRAYIKSKGAGIGFFNVGESGPYVGEPERQRGELGL